MLTTIKEHDHPSMIDQVDIITRDIGIAMMTAATRAIKYPQVQDKGEEGGERRNSGYHRKDESGEIGQKTLTHHQRTSLMDPAVYITHTLMTKESLNFNHNTTNYTLSW
jgi:hypothetical protein